MFRHKSTRNMLDDFIYKHVQCTTNIQYANNPLNIDTMFSFRRHDFKNKTRYVVHHTNIHQERSLMWCRDVTPMKDGGEEADGFWKQDSWTSKIEIGTGEMESKKMSERDAFLETKYIMNTIRSL